MTAVIDYQLATQASQVPETAQLERWVTAVLEQHPQESRHEVTIRIVDADESQALNADYRGKHKPTNVLSFPFEAPPGIELPLLGDLVICQNVVAQEAQQQHKPLMQHYAHMVIHGTLHLLGYDHIEDADAEAMEQLERRLLAKFNIPDPYLSETQ
ncbi:MAG: rRNA maturation RNase YbeY [Pseudomonadota bacterium]